MKIFSVAICTFFLFCSLLSAEEEQIVPSSENPVQLDEIIQIRQAVPQGKITGILPPPELIPSLSEKFFDAVNYLPTNFIQNSGIRYVTFLKDLKFKGLPVAGMASKDINTIYLSTTFKAKTIYHELYHIFDPIRENQYWCQLNAHNFIYTGSKFYSENLSKSKYKKVSKNLSRMTYNLDFVSRYAMSNEREDRAETFAYMIVEGPKFFNRTKRSHVLKKKMDYIIQITTQKKLVSPTFWKKHFSARENRIRNKKNR